MSATLRAKVTGRPAVCVALATLSTCCFALLHAPAPRLTPPSPPCAAACPAVVSEAQQADPRLLASVYDDMAQKFRLHGLQLPAVEAMRAYFACPDGPGESSRPACAPARALPANASGSLQLRPVGRRPPLLSCARHPIHRPALALRTRCTALYCRRGGAAGLLGLPSAAAAGRRPAGAHLLSGKRAGPPACCLASSGWIWLPACSPARQRSTAWPRGACGLPRPHPRTSAPPTWQELNAQLAAMVHEAAQEVVAALPEGQQA